MVSVKTKLRVKLPGRVALPRKYIVVFAPLLLLIVLYAWNVGGFPPANTGAEQAGSLGVNSGVAIIDNASFGPQKIADYVLFKLGGDNVLYFRLVSVSFTLIAVALFFFLIKHWISLRVAALGSLLFATSSWLLYDARWAEFDSILLMAIPALLVAGSFLKIKEYDPLLPLTTFLVALTLYVPGLWVIVLGGLIMVRSDLAEAWQVSGARSRVLWLASFVLPTLPLIYSLSQGDNWLRLLGLPEGISTSVFLRNLLYLPGQLFVNGIPDVWQWLPGTPVLDAVTTALTAIGVAYVVIDRRYPIRRNVLLGLIIPCIILIGLAGAAYISLVLPLIYIFAAFGTAFLLEQWFHIFPLNPVARGFGIVIVAILISSTAAYHLARYYHAWPQSHAAHQIFQQK